MFHDRRPLAAPTPARRRLATLGFALLAMLYLLPGLVGHDPWRGDDAAYFGPIFDMLSGEGLLFPSIAGTPSADFPPLYYWTGALLAKLFAWLLPVHDGARLASALFTGLTIYWIVRAAERLYDRTARTPAALLTLGTLGLVVHAHETQPMLALMAMQALTLAGLARLPAHPLRGAMQAGLGAALAFLAGGLPGMLLTFPLFLLVPLASPECHTPRASSGLLLGLCLALGASALWPLAVHYQEPELLSLMWRQQWTGFATDPVGAADLPRLLELFGWFVWPLWPIALWALWRLRRQLAGLPAVLPICATILALAWIVANGDVRPAAMLPLIPPLALLAASGAPTLRRGAANAFDWFAVMSFAVFAILVWLAWSAQAFSWPPGLARHLAKLAPTFELTGSLQQALVGGAISVAWLLVVWRLPRAPNRGPINWAVGMTMLWSLAVALLQPWFEHGKSYRPVAQSLVAELRRYPDQCVATFGLSDSQRAALYYFANIRPQHAAPGRVACPLLLVYDDRSPSAAPVAGDWRPIWQYRRGGGKQLEIFRLYHRD